MSGPNDKKRDEKRTTPLFGPEGRTPQGDTRTPDEQRTTPYDATPLDAAGRTPSDESPLITQPAISTEAFVPEESLRALAERYDLLAELGRGGMGVVYRARDRETGAEVALKVLLPEISAKAELIERFKSELILARKITHKNVCRVHELIRLGNVAAISMEYVKGESLRSVLQRPGGVSLRGGIEWTKQICSGLAEAHGQGVIHRDLKPENILIAQDGSAKVMDFGIARSFEGTSTSTGHVIGTPAYMSPEQAQGKVVDSRSDIYSLGLILYEIFTGKPAFVADTPAGYMLKHIDSLPVPPRTTEASVPEYVDIAIAKCMEKDPQKRFQSVLELEASLSGRRVAPSPGNGVASPLNVPLSLLVWGKRDFLLLAFGLLGAFAYFSLQENIFPSRMLQIGVDRNVALRLAQENARRFGAESEPVQSADLQFSASTRAIDADSIAWGDLLWSKGMRAVALRLEEISPFRWAVRLGGAEPGSPGSFYLLSAKDGKLLGFVQTLRERNATSEVAPPLDALMQRAQGELSQLFSPKWAEFIVESEYVGNSRGYWAYTVSFVSKEVEMGSRLRFRATITDGKPTFLSRSVVFPAGVGKVLPKILEWPRGWDTASTIALCVLLIILFILFRKLVLSNWKAALFLAFVFAAATAYMGIAGWWISGSLAIDEFLKSFALSGIIAFLGFAVTLPVLGRTFPEKLASLRNLSGLIRGRHGLGLSMMRGCFIGFALLGLHNGIVNIGLGEGKYWAEPDLFAFPAIAGFPALYVAANAILQTLTVSLIGITLPISLLAWRGKRKKSLLSISAALWLSLIVSGQLQWLQPWPATVSALFLAGLILSLAFLEYDLATLIVGLLTFELGLLGFPSGMLLREVGPSSLFGVVILWAGLLLFGALAYWAPTLRLVARRVVTGFE